MIKLLLAALLVIPYLAFAHDDAYTKEENELLGTLRTPEGMVESGAPVMCCNVHDCKKTNDRMIGDHYEAWIDERWNQGGDHDGPMGDRAPMVRITPHWEVVPASALLEHVRNPMGSAVACFYQGKIICFLRAVEA